jgi:hypothetical protein
MNATFTTDQGAVFTISNATMPPPKGAEAGKLYPTVQCVLLQMAHNYPHSYLKKSEARAIASALMGAAAELS